MCSCNDLTKYDFHSPEMRKYLGTYGPHINKRLCLALVKLMRDRNDKRIEMPEKSVVISLLDKYGIELENDMLYDSVYVYCMIKADSWGSSIEDEAHLARAISDYIDDADGYEGLVFSRVYTDLCKKGIALDWEEFL